MSLAYIEAFASSENPWSPVRVAYALGAQGGTSELFAEMTNYLVQDMRGERCMGIGRFISEMRRLQGAHGEPDTGDPADLKSAVCLKYIYNFCKVYVRAQEYQDLIDNDDDHYVVNPYKELICFSYVQSDAYTRWSAWWQHNGGSLTQGRMIAFRDDVIWRRINQFGFNHAPWNFAQDADTRAIGRSEAKRLGLPLLSFERALDNPRVNPFSSKHIAL